MNRPFAVSILAVLAAIAGIVAIGDVLRYLGLFPAIEFGPVQFFGQSLIGALLSGLVALIWLWSAIRIWNLDPQGWLFIVVIAVVYLIFGLVSLLGGNSFGNAWPSIIVSGFALILGLLPGTKRAFNQ